MIKLKFLVFLLLFTACQAGLDGDIRERHGAIRVKNVNPGPWTNVSLVLDGEYKMELDSISAGQDTTLMLVAFKNEIGQNYMDRGTRPRQLMIQAAQGILRKSWQ